MAQGRATNLRDLSKIESQISYLSEMEEELISKALTKITIPSGTYKPKELIGCYEYNGPTELKSANTFLSETLTKINEFIAKVKAADNPEGTITPPSPDEGDDGDDGRELPTLTDPPKPADTTNADPGDNETPPDIIDGGIIAGLVDAALGDEGDGNPNGMVTPPSGPFKGTTNPGIYMPSSDGQLIYDANGNIIGYTDKSKYQVYEVKRDADGNIIAIRISPDGEVPERWIRVTPSSGVFIAGSKEGQFVIEDGSMNIYDANGNIIGKAEPGKYKVYDVMYNEDGSIVAIRISEDGVVPEQWIRVGEGNAIAHMEFVGQVGKYEFTGDYIDIFDKDGNVIGRLPAGEYPVYDTKTDENGNVIAIRISPDGEPERWLSIYENGEYIGNYSPFGEIQECKTNSDKARLSMFGKGAFIVGGILGVLAVAAGARMIMKNKKDGKTSELPEGSYDIYGTRMDQNGNITDARISPNGEEEYWVHVYDEVQ